MSYPISKEEIQYLLNFYKQYRQTDFLFSYYFNQLPQDIKNEIEIYVMHNASSYRIWSKNMPLI